MGLWKYHTFAQRRGDVVGARRETRSRNLHHAYHISHAVNCVIEHLRRIVYSKITHRKKTFRYCSERNKFVFLLCLDTFNLVKCQIHTMFYS